MTSSERRARNEALFRTVNERMREIGDRLDTAAVGAPTAEREEFFCECGRLDCMERIELTRTQYERARSDPAYFLVIPDHVNREIENLVEEHPSYVIVKKYAHEAEIAEESDPRDGG